MHRLIIIWLLSAASLIAQTVERPNILWIYAEDTSPWMGCYGDPVSYTHLTLPTILLV